jgi:hypothetical protein
VAAGRCWVKPGYGQLIFYVTLLLCITCNISLTGPPHPSQPTHCNTAIARYAVARLLVLRRALGKPPA